MIPARYCIKICCDRCGDQGTFILQSEDIDAKGMYLYLDELLRDAAWGISGDFTFCPKCVDRALAEALGNLAREVKEKPRDSSADAEASP